VEVRRVEKRIVMSSLDSCLTYCVVITSFLVIIFTNLASDHPFVHGQPTNFSFTSFDSTSIDEIILLDDAAQYFSEYVVLNALKSATGRGPGCGKLMYKEKVQMFYPSTGAVASFQTSFTFSILPALGQLQNTGDGFAFTFMPDNVTEGAAGGTMCIQVDRTDGTANSYFAVEFDTHQNPDDDDPSNNHVGVDVNSFSSVSTYNLCNLTSNDTTCTYLANPDTNFTAWIDYDATTEVLDVWLANGSSSSGILKPNQPVIHFNLNQSNSLSNVFSDAYMYVGFSGSIGSAREANKIVSWSFASSGLPVPPSLPSASPRLGPAPVPSEASTPANSSTGVPGDIIIASTVVIVVLLLLVLACVIWCSRHRRKMTIQPAMSHHHFLNIGPRKFNYLELCMATQNFSEEQLLGSGGCGSVYKGVLQDTGSVVAVKRITKESEQGETDFVAEISVISQVRHRNLVQLRGWCHEEGKLLLVYDFMSNTSLDKWLFINPEKFRDSPPRRVLSWDLRYNILTGVAAALYYLHEEWEQCILHRDIKASNVMLDTNFKAKLGDFGLARLIDHDKLPHTSLLAGTLGYLAPELPYTCKATKTTDVYSFGVLSLEVACGRRVFSPIAPQSRTLLLDYVWHEHKKKSILNVVDPRLEMDFVEEEVLRVLHVGLLCSHPDPEARPNMRLVNRYLNGEVLMPSLPESQPEVSYSMNGQVEATESTELTATLDLQIAEEDPAKSFTNFLSKSDDSII
jgi:serine/threonine protein kinase